MYSHPCQSQIKAAFTDSPVRLDGILNEKAWENADPVSDFTQRELVEGAAPTELTEVYFLFDNNNFYVGVKCYDSDPPGIVHRVLTRDKYLFLIEDNFTIVLDTYNDKRSGYYLAVNPNGSQVDGTFRTYEKVNTQWDGIWDVASRITEEGWFCEIRIPFKTLRFHNTPSQIWGINFRRQIVRKNEELMWRGWRRDDDIIHLSKGGTIIIDRALKSSRQIDVKPYILSGLEKTSDTDPDGTFKTGLDVTLGLTSNTTLVLTTNTDFAHIESDQEVINLTRYNISYPEKRNFFLEGSEIFTFSQGMTNVFYSRRIGISPDRKPVPILGGAKLTQKSGSYTMGVLTMQTEGKYGYPSTNYSVFRVKKDVLNQSYVGFITTSIMEADGHDNQVMGGDMILKTDTFRGNKNFEVQSYLVGSLTDGKGDKSLAGRIYVSYPNDMINAYMLYHALGPGFNPELGFISGKKPGIHQYMGRFDFRPRTSMPFIKQFDFEPIMINYYTDMDRKLIARTVAIRPFGIISKSEDRFSITVENQFDYVEEAYTMFDKVDIEKRGYEWWSTELSFQSSGSRSV